MIFLDLTLESLPENLALDEALLVEAEEGGPEAMRLWEWPTPAVVLGAGGQLALDVDELACRAGNVPIFRRGSGGGTVLLGRGCLLYSVILSLNRAPELEHVRSSFAWILRRMIDSLAGPGLDLRQAGISDLVLGQCKVSGNAQQRKRSHLLHHGTLLCDFDLTLVAKYLRLPTRQPEYRQHRSHEEFLANLPLDGAEIRRRIALAWPAAPGERQLPLASARQLAREKYEREEWIRRR